MAVKLAAGIALVAGLLLSACGSSLRYSLNTPPLVNGPAATLGINDGRSRFREIYCAVRAERGAMHPYDRPCDQALHRLNGEAAPSGRPVYLGQARTPLRIVIAPGIFGECAEGMARPFDDAVAPLARLGYSVVPLRISGRSSSAANAASIRAQLAALALRPGERLVLIGYSKGMSDLIELIASADRAVIPSGSAVVSLTGVVSGTPIADGGESLYRAFWWVPLPGCRPGDGGGVASLTREHRMNYLATHSLPQDLHYFSVPAFTTASNISSFLKSSYAALSRIDARNDGNVLFYDSVIPGSTLLGYVNSDHWALALPFSLQAPFRSRFFATRNEFPRVVLLESIARSIEEHLVARDQPK